jgi:activating signal cointegrator complex subunit 1
VDGLLIEASRSRANDIPNPFGESAEADGHWGVTFTRCADVMVRNFDVRCSLVHDVGTDTGSKWSVVMVGAAQRRPAALSPCGMVAAVREASGFLRQAVL